MMKAFFSLILLWELTGFLGVLGRHKLDFVQVLLPYTGKNTKDVTHTIHAEKGGCYDWKVEREDIANVKPLFDETGCSTAAVIIPTSAEKKRVSTTLFATERDSGSVLACTVIVDLIHKIELATTTRVLHVGGKEKFYVQAFDQEGNIFTSVLNGLRFKWTLSTTKGSSSYTEILKFDTFIGDLHVEDEINELEARGYRGYAVLLHGIGSGVVEVRAEIDEPEYRAPIVAPTSAPVTVSEQFFLSPALTYTLPFSIVPLKILRHRNNQFEEIPNSRNKYSWFTTDGSILNIREGGNGIVETFAFGDAEIIVTENGMPENKKMAKIFVVEPVKMNFTLRMISDEASDEKLVESVCEDSWFLMYDRTYIWTIYIYDNNGNNFTKEDIVYDYTLSSLMDSEYVTSNHSYHHVHTKDYGQGFLKASLSSLKKFDGSTYQLEKPLHAETAFTIVSPIAVSPKRKYIPYSTAHTTGFRHHVFPHAITVQGGSELYQVDRSHGDSVETHLDINAKAINLTPLAIGKSVFKVKDVRQELNFDTFEIHVIGISRIEFIPYKSDFMVDSVVTVPLQLYGIDENLGSEVRFENCSNIPVDVGVENPGGFLLLSLSTSKDYEKNIPEESRGCLYATYKVLKEGKTTLTASLSGSKSSVHAEKVVYGYVKPRLVGSMSNPKISCGSSYPIHVEGGPLSSSKQLSVSCEAADPDALSITRTYEEPSSLNQYQSSQIISWSVQCQKVGEHAITVSIGLPDEKNTINTSVRCGTPENLVVENKSVPPRCPHREQNSYFLELGKTHGFTVTAQEFMNSSSIVYEWKTNDTSIVAFEPSSPGEQKILIGEKAGVASVTVCLSKYDRKTMYLPCATLDSKSVKPCSTVIVHAVPGVRFASTNTRFVRDPKNHVKLPISGGSRHFVVSSDAMDVASAVLQFDNSHAMIHGKSNGNAAIKVTDLCLLPESTDMLSLEFSSVSQIVASGPDKVVVGHEIPVLVKLLDENSQPFDRSQYQFVTITTPPQGGIQVQEKTMGVDTLKYTVKGLVVGHHQLVFQADLSSGEKITSNPVPIQVVDELNIQPSFLELIEGARFQAEVSPSTYTHDMIDFSSSDPNIFRVNSEGIITALKEGNAMLHGSIKSSDPERKTFFNLTEDSIKVRVIRLEGITIIAPTTSIIAGNNVTFYAGGNENKSPFMFGNSGLSFEWESSDPSVVSLESIYWKAGVGLQVETDFSALIVPKKKGTARVTVRSIHPVNSALSYTASAEVHVVEPLQLIDSPNVERSFCNCDNCIGCPTKRANYLQNVLMAPNSRYEINHDRVKGSNANCRFSLVDSSSSVKVSQQGVVTAGLKEAQASIEVRCEEFGVFQSIVVNVEVQNIHHLSLIPGSSSSRLPSYQMPVGASVEWSVDIYTRHGRRFHALPKKMNFDNDFNNQKVVSVVEDVQMDEFGNHYLTVHADEQGDTILQLCLVDMNLVAPCTYVRLLVGDSVIPSNPLVHAGAKFSFFVSGDRSSGWGSKDPSIVEVINAAGTVVAKKQGSVDLYCKHPNTKYVHVVVAPVSRIELFPVDFNHVSNSPDTKNLIEVAFYSDSSTRFSSLPASASSDRYLPNVPYVCSVDPKAAAVFAIESYLDETNGNPYCSLRPKHKTRLPADLKEVEVTVKVLNGAMDGRAYIEKSATYEFRPGFVVNTTQILFSGHSSSRVIKIYHALNHLPIVANYPADVLKVTSLDAFNKNELQFRVEKLPGFTGGEVEFKSKTSGQSTKVLIESDGFRGNRQTSSTSRAGPGVDSSESDEIFSQNILTTLFFLILILCAAIFAYVLSRPGYNHDYEYQAPPTRNEYRGSAQRSNHSQPTSPSYSTTPITTKIRQTSGRPY